MIHGGPLFTTRTEAVLTAAHIGHFLLTRRNKLPIAKFTTHDLRRTVATRLAELGISLELIAAVIGHEAGGRETRTLVRHYMRSDLLERKAQVLWSWDEWVQGVVAGREVSKVIPFQKAG